MPVEPPGWQAPENLPDGTANLRPWFHPATDPVCASGVLDLHQHASTRLVC